MGELSGGALMLAHTLQKTDVLGSDDEPEDGDDDLDKAHAPIAVDGEERDHAALDLEISPSPFSSSADQVEDGGIDEGDNDTGNNVSLRGAKRQRSRPAGCEPNLHHTSTPPLSHHENGESNTANSCSTCSDDSGSDSFLLKRGKLSDFPNSGTTSSSHNGQPPCSLLPPALKESEKPGDGIDVSTSLPVEDNLTSAATTMPELSVSGSVRMAQLSPELAYSSQDWEVREVIGKEYIDGVLHYMVEWCPTLVPEHSLGHNIIFVFGVGLVVAAFAGLLMHRLPSSLACPALRWASLAFLCLCAVHGVAPRTHPPALWRERQSASRTAEISHLASHSPYRWPSVEFTHSCGPEDVGT